MMIRRGPRPDRYVILGNELVRNPRLSFRARGLLAYLLSMPEDWRTNAGRIANESPLEGRDAILTALKELELAGYLKRVKYQDTGGRWHTDTIVVDNPVDMSASYPLPETAEPTSVDPALIEELFTKDSSVSSSTHSYARDPFCERCRGYGWATTETEIDGLERCQCQRSKR